MAVTYALLTHPGHFRVYMDRAHDMAKAELSVCARRLPVETELRGISRLGGVDYLIFDADSPLDEPGLRLLSRLSFVCAVYRMESGALYPEQLFDTPCFDRGFSSMLKYSGKTNETFTRLLINFAAFSSSFDPLMRLKLLDPMCGKGTALFEALSLGWDAAGIELEKRPPREAATFFKQYLERGRYKHSYEKGRPGPNQKLYPADSHLFGFAKSSEGMSSPQRLEIIHADARHAPQFFKSRSFHMICADLPYGIRHGSASDGRSPSRNPYTLLSQCLSGWSELLLPGGTLALSWNTFLISRESIAALLEKNGLSVCASQGYPGLEHRVDQAIRRDLIVAVRP